MRVPGCGINGGLVVVLVTFYSVSLNGEYNDANTGCEQALHDSIFDVVKNVYNA